MPLGLWTLLDLAPPGQGAEHAGILLVDPHSDCLYSRFRRDLDEIIPEESDVVALLEDDLQLKARDLGAVAMLDWLEDSASNFFRAAEREQMEVSSFPSALSWLYHRHIRPKVLPFRTHLPVYSLQAAAGNWGPNRDVPEEPSAWVEAPPDLRLSDDLFVTQVVGRSMEPLIRDGQFCVFRAGVKGARSNRKVLVVNQDETGDERFTIKIYERTAAPGEAGRRVIMRPLNPGFEPWEIDPESDRVAVLAEFVRALDGDEITRL